MGAAVGRICYRELLMMLAACTFSVLVLASVGSAHQEGHLKALTKRQASVPLVPGNIPGLVPGSPAAAAWWTAQIAHAGQLAHHVGKRQAAVPLTPGNIPGLVSGSETARQWWTNQLLWAQQQAHHVGKREAVEVPAGVSAAFCPNYPFCTIVPAGYVNTAGYPAGVSAAARPGCPYC